MAGSNASFTVNTSSLDRLDHDIDCQEPCCENKTRIDRVENRLEVCNTLTNPETMAKQDDPLKQAFVLTNKINKIKKTNIEINSELRACCKKAKKFTVELLNVCKTSKEVSVVFDFDENKDKTMSMSMANRKKISKVLADAVAAHHSEFVSHRHAQQLLREIIYEKPRPANFLSGHGILQVLMVPLILPILACLFLFGGKKYRIKSCMSTPYGKFVSHASQFCIFVVLLGLSSLQDDHEIPTARAINRLITTFIMAMVIQQIRKFIMTEKPRSSYFSQNKWNCVLMAILVGFLVSEPLWWIGSPARLKEVQLLANSIFSICSIISVFYLGSFWQVNSVLGPLQLSTLWMFKDIGKFLAIFLGVFIAFTTGLRNLYSYRRSLDVGYLADHNSTEHHVEDELGSFGGAWQVMFWALFDQTNVDKFETTDAITSKSGQLLFAIYLIITVLVGLNMLVAMMNNSYEYVANDKNFHKWRMSRTAMWLEYADDDKFFLPPPYNILEYLLAFFKYCCKKRCPQREPEDSEMMKMNDKGKENSQSEDRSRILNEIIQRYLEEKSKEHEDTHV